MVVDLYSESSSMGTTSPRISFSHDFCQSDVVPVEHHPLRSNSIDFDFCVREGFDQESSSADELFSDGKILPTQIKKKAVAIATTKPMDQCGSHHHPPLPLPRTTTTTTTTTTSGNKSTSKQESPKENSKSFWRFTRSSSCGSGYGRSLCPLPPLLSRSNSTGSAVNSRQSSQKHASMKASQSSPSAAAAAGGYPRPPLKKGIHGSYGNINGVRISPVLNVPPANNLFGLGSIFSSSGRDKNRKK